MSSTSIYIRDYHTEIPGKLSDDRLAWMFPCVESTNSHGRKTEWCIRVQALREGEFVTIEDSWFDNKPLDSIHGWIKVDSRMVGGVVKKSVPTIVKKGKNLGKSSATNAFCQAVRDAYSLYNKQSKKAVGDHAFADADVAAGVVERFPPMLAQVFKDQKVPPKIDENNHAFVQRKYNGVRAVATLDAGEVVMYSRRKLSYPGFQHIKDELAPILEMYWEEGRFLYLDGEIYKHGASLQDISGWARRSDSGADLDYMVYDCFVANEPELSFAARREILDEIFGEFELAHVQGVETFEVTLRDEIEELYCGFIEEGYEGAMVRLNTPYKYSYNEHHSKVLLKMKETYDHEFEIVRWETGLKGKAAGALMIVCVANGIEFPVTPAMEINDRLALAKKMAEIEPNGRTHFENHWLGKPLIVYFDEWSRDKVPQRGRTKMEIRTWA